MVRSHPAAMGWSGLLTLVCRRHLGQSPSPFPHSLPTFVIKCQLQISTIKYLFIKQTPRWAIASKQLVNTSQSPVTPNQHLNEYYLIYLKERIRGKINSEKNKYCRLVLFITDPNWEGFLYPTQKNSKKSPF